MQTSRQPLPIIKSHEGLRGLAARDVAMFHASTIDSIAPGLERVSLISNAVSFLLRRCGRLYPLHLSTLVLFLVIWLTMQLVKWFVLIDFDITVGQQPMFDSKQVNGQDLLLNLFLLHGVGLHWTDALNYP